MQLALQNTRGSLSKSATTRIAGGMLKAPRGTLVPHLRRSDGHLRIYPALTRGATLVPALRAYHIP